MDQLPPIDKLRPHNKSARKISMPTWLRSNNSPRSSQSLPRQYTIDSPDTFLISKKSPGAKTPISPLTALGFENAPNNNDSKCISNDSEGADETPKKASGFSGKKWLPEPLRKLSRHKGKKSRDQAITTPPAGTDNVLPTPTDCNADTSKADSEPEEPLKVTTGVETETTEDLAMAQFYVPSVDTPVGEGEPDQDDVVEAVQEKVDIMTLSEPTTGHDQALKNREHVLKELISTEKAYIQDLALIVEGYIAEIRNPESSIPMPEDLSGGKERMVFGNIEAIFEWHRDYFLKSLQACVDKLTELGPLIQKCERKLRMYVVYCQNKPISEYIVSEHFGYFDEIGRKLNHKLQLSDLLIKPVQRITKYELLLKDVLKYTQKLDDRQDEVDSLSKALRIMTVVPKDANDMMDVGRIQNFEGSITSQGKLLLHDKFMVFDNSAGGNNAGGNKKAKDFQVFLFEQSIIFSDITGKKTRFSNPSYLYKTHLQLNKMTVKDTSDRNTNKLLISSTDPHRINVSFTLVANSVSQHQDWLEKIEQILEAQRNFLKKIVNPQK